MLSARSARLLAASPALRGWALQPRLLQVAPASSSSRDGRAAQEEPPEWAREESEEELQHRQRPLRLAVKVFVASWVSYKAYGYLMQKDDLMVGSTLTLLRSTKEATRVSGLYRVNEWHTSDGARQAIVNKDGIETILNSASLSAASDPPTCNLALHLLNDLCRYDGAKDKLMALDGVTTARAACDSMEKQLGTYEAQGCREMATQLEESLSKSVR